MFSAAAHVCSWGAIVFPQLCLSKSLRLFRLPERKPETGHQPDSIKSWLRVDISGNCGGTAGSVMVIRREEVVQCAVLVRVAGCAGPELRSAPLNALSQIYRLLKATKGRSRVKKGPCKAWGSMNNSLMGSRCCCQAQRPTTTDPLCSEFQQELSDESKFHL